MNKRTLCLLAALSCFCLTTIADESPQASTIRVAVYGDSGADGFKLFPPLLKDAQGIQTEVLNGEQIRDSSLDKFDLLILPGGSGSGQAKSLGTEGVKKVKRFIKSGKGLIAIGAGAYFTLDQDIINARTKDPRWDRGVTNLKIEFSELGLNIVGDKFKGEQEVSYCSGPVMDVNYSIIRPNSEVLAWFRTETAQNGTPKGIQVNSPAIILTAYGKGTVVVVSPRLEQTPSMKEVVVNLIRHVADNRCFGKEPPCVIRTEASQPNPIVASAVKYMNAMGTVEWIPAEEIPWYSPSKKVSFHAGEKYKGIPYTQAGRYTSLEQFKTMLRTDEHGQSVYSGPFGAKQYRGTDCSSSCSYSWKHVIPYLPVMYTGNMGPGYLHIINPKTGKTVPIFRRVGDYRITDFHKSKNVIEENGRPFMERCYDQLLPGDALIKRPNGHVIMVCRVDQAAKVVYITEQGGTNPDDRSQFLSDHQTWRVQYPFTYDKLIEDGYLPIAINEEILIVPEK
ncbi:MAG: DJ-1/PfpI family protein [Thermoguttaceae bacterium]|nr:DJ-1/PfpI family protein [Thermoguttaceae bacterium]